MDKRDLRQRITEEDTLLGNRTHSFLLANGFLMAALALSDVGFEKVAIGVLGTILTLVWLLIGWQVRRAITALHELYQKRFPDDEINEAVFSRIMWKWRAIGTICGPTELITAWMPLTILIVWIFINANMYLSS